MTSTTTTFNTNFDLDLIRSSLVETEHKCASFCEKVEKNHQRTFDKHKKVKIGPIMSIMNSSNQFINEATGNLSEKSDGDRAISNDGFCTFQKSVHSNVSNGHSPKNGNMAMIDRSKPFVPPKQVLMYIVR